MTTKENDMRKYDNTSKYDTREGWKLVNTNTLTEIKVGDQVETSDGEKVKITWLNPPHKPSSQGKVSVEFIGRDWSQEFYASVVGAEYQYKENDDDS